MWQPLGKVSGVSVTTLVSRSSAISPFFFISLARAATSNSDMRRSVPTTLKAPFLYSMSPSPASSAAAATFLPLASIASSVFTMAWPAVMAVREPTEA